MLTCRDHTLFAYDGRQFRCVGCGQPARPEPPKPEAEPEAAAEGTEPAEMADSAAESPAPDPDLRGVGVKTPRHASRIKAH